MATVNGVVEQVNFREGPTWKKVSLKVRGEWYGGFISEKSDKIEDDRTKAAEGDTVSIDFAKSKDGRFLNIEKVTLVSKAAEAPVTVGPKSTTSVVQEYIPSALRDLRITIAGARNSAIEFVRLALEREAISLGSKAKNKIDVLHQHVDHYTGVFATQLLDATQESLRGTSVSTKEVREEDDNYAE